MLRIAFDLRMGEVSQLDRSEEENHCCSLPDFAESWILGDQATCLWLVCLLFLTNCYQSISFSLESPFCQVGLLACICWYPCLLRHHVEARV